MTESGGLMAELPARRLHVTLDQPAAPAPASQPDWKEYYYVQDLITGFNKDCLEIKKWSVATASIVAVVGQSGLRNLPLVLMLIMALALVFWITETIWRMNQWAFIRYVRTLEPVKGAPRISGKWAEAYLGEKCPVQTLDEPCAMDSRKEYQQFLSHLVKGRTFLPHGVILVLAGAALALVLSGVFTEPAREPSPQEIRGSLDVRLEGEAGSANAVAIGNGQ